MKEYVKPNLDVCKVEEKDVLMASGETQTEIINDLNLNWIKETLR